MRAPVTTSTSPAQVQQRYLQGSGANGFQAVAKGLGNVGEAFGQLAARTEQRNNQTDRFNTLKTYSEFETNLNVSLADLKRNASPDGKGFTQAASDLYDKQADAYVANVPPELQPEFKARIAQGKQGVMGQALTFQYQAGDAWFKQGVDDEVSKSKTVLDQNPKALQQEQKRLAEFISATDLPEAVKLEYARNANIGLESVTYKSEVRNDAGARYKIGVGSVPGGDFAATADALIKKEEGYVPGAMWDVNHARVGYSSDTITNPDGSFRSVTKDDTTTREGAQRDLDRRIKAADTAGAEVAPGVWEGLGGNVKAGLASVFYHYGSYPSEVKTAIRTGDPSQIAAAVSELKSNPPRREREAAVILGNSKIEADPRFANIPYEDKVALREDADREAKQQYTAEQAAAKDQLNQDQNNLYVGLMDGTLGQADIQSARQQGTLTDYNDIKKANDILAGVNETINLQSNALTKLQGGTSWDPADTDDKKMLNALVGKGGLAQINSGNADYIHNGIVPLVSQTGDIPTSVAGTLTGMVRGQNNTQAMFALDSLAQLRDTNPYAFNQRVGNDIAQAVEYWDSHKNIAADQTTLLNSVRGGMTASDRANQQALRDEAKGMLSRNDGGVPGIKALAATAMGEFDGWVTSASTNGNPVAQQAFEKEFGTLFIDKYALTGNAESATELASKEMQRNWGVTTVGNQSGQVMKLPPEKVGYRQINGSYDWINEEARRELGLAAGENFQLFSDDQTQSEWNRGKQGPTAQPPSYRIFTVDKDGVARERVDENGQPARLWFKPPQDLVQFENDTFDHRDRVYKLESDLADLKRIQGQAEFLGEPMPEADQKALDDTTQQLETLRSATPVNPRKPQLNPADFPSELGAF